MDDDVIEVTIPGRFVVLALIGLAAWTAWKFIPMGILKPVFATGFTAVVLLDAYDTLREGDSGWGDIRWYHYAAAIPLIATVFAVRWACLQIGWMQFSPVGALFGAPSSDQNVYFTPLDYLWLAVPFLAAIGVQLPRLAAWEERKFREGLHSWQHAVVWSVIFGYAHCLVGVSLATGAGLSVAGLYLSAVYFRGGVRASTAAHAAMNAVLLLPLLMLAILVTVVFVAHSMWAVLPW